MPPPSGSADTVPADPAPADDMLTQAWALSEAVALRPEPFGALAYHFGNRTLTFLKSPELVTTVTGLATHPDVAGALTAAGVAPAEHPRYLVAVRALAATEMIEPRR